MLPSLSLLLVLASEPAHAVLPDPAGPTSRPDRVLRYHVARQAELRKGQAWQRFLSTEDPTWQARFDELTGLPVRAWGRGLDLGPTRNADEVEAALRALMTRHPALVGVSLNDIELTRARYVPQNDTWYVRFGQRVEGVPVRRGDVEARIRQGRLVAFGTRTLPGVILDQSPVVGAEEAVGIALTEGPAPRALHTLLTTREVVLPLEVDGRLLHPRCWEVRSETTEPRGRWAAYVDQATGVLLSVHNEILFGTVQGTHDTRTVNGSYTTSPMPFIRVSNGTETGSADEDGVFSLRGESFTSELRGTYARIRNSASGGDGLLSFTGSDGIWTTSAATQAEIDAYVFVHHVEDWAEFFAPDVTSKMGSVTVRVNQDSYCNAYYDGAINTFREGGGCNNTGRIADVIYHEWGHGYHFYASDFGYYFDATLSEGIADLSSVLQTGDPIIGPYFFTSGGGIRDVSGLRVYPDNYYGESHEDSLIFSGAIWDFLQTLTGTYGGEEAWFIVSQLLADMARGTTDIFDAYDELVALDDDNADLSDGTPHQCALLDAFTAHGLGPSGAGGLVSLLSLPLADQAEGPDTYVVEAEIQNLAPACVLLDLDRVTLHWSLDSGESWSSEAMDTAGDRLSGAIPAPPAGSIVHYYISIEAADGSSYQFPASGAVLPSHFLVGEAPELYFEDFETTDGDYAHELIAGDDALGADDWQWGNPNGQADDPEDAWSGRKVWGNDLGYSDWNGEYQNDKHNRLSTPAISVAPYVDLGVEFHRWLNVEDGYYDQANVLIDGVLAWTNHATSRAIGDEHSRDDQWARMVLPAEDPERDGLVVLSWEIVSDGGLSMGGWNLDDVRVVALPTTRNLLVVRDFAVDDAEGSLIWSNPSLAELARVRVVGRTDRYPVSADDGDLLFEDLSPTPGGAGSAILDAGVAGAWYLAAFAASVDGTWSEGAYEGFNAGPLSGEGGEDTEDSGHQDSDDTAGDPPSGKGEPSCGCAASQRPFSPALLAFLPLLLGLARARRRDA